MIKYLSLASLLLALPATAQLTSTVPAGFDTTLGGQSFFHWGSSAGRTIQVADRSNLRPRAIPQLAFRRRANSTGPGAGTLDAEVVMAETQFALLDTNFDANQRINRRVVLSGTVNLPDWSTAQPMPAFDLTFKFTTPYVFTGQRALVWTIRYDQAPSSGRTMDRAFGAIRTRTTASSLGAGCSGAGDLLYIENSGNYSNETGMHLVAGATGGPANAPAFLLIDTMVSNINAGLCTTLRVLPTILLPMGNADASGAISNKYVSFPYNANVQGATIATQWFFVDPTQPGLPLRLTGGRSGQMPTSSNAAGTACAYMWASGRTTPAGSTWFFTGAPVADTK